MDTYDFENKNIYRERRESAIDRMLDIPKPMRRVAYLDTKEALDTISYIKRGYVSKNLYAINNNPAEMACLTMKLKSMNLPTINTYGLDFEDALDRKIPAVDIIDFDGMGCLNNKLSVMLQRITLSRPKAVYGVTLLGGRESIKSGPWWPMIKHLPINKTVKTSYGSSVNRNHYARVWILLNVIMNGNVIDKEGPNCNIEEFNSVCRSHITKIFWDVYMSISKQPMIWVVMKITPHKKLKLKTLKKIMKNTKHMYSPICSSSLS